MKERYNIAVCKCEVINIREDRVNEIVHIEADAPQGDTQNIYLVFE